MAEDNIDKQDSKYVAIIRLGSNPFLSIKEDRGLQKTF